MFPRMKVRETETNKPLFIGGTQRSGTSLLRALIDSNTDIYFPPAEMKFFIRFYHRLKSFEPLRLEENRKRFFTEYGKYRKIIMRSDIVNKAGLLGLAEEGTWSWPKVFNAIMCSLAAGDGKLRWGEKSPGNEFFTEQIMQFYPKAKIICTLRDPRGVVASSRRRYGRGLIKPLMRWRMAARKIAFDFQRLPSETFHVVFYEDLVLNLEETIRKVFEFIEPELTNPPDALRIEEAKWGRGGKSSYNRGEDKDGIVWKGSLTAHQEELSAMERAIIRTLARREIALLGYDKEAQGPLDFHGKFSANLKSSGRKIRYYPAMSRAINLITDRPLRVS